MILCVNGPASLGDETCNPVMLLKATLKEHNILKVVGCLYIQYIYKLLNKLFY
jgi:hypothetical protein